MGALSRLRAYFLGFTRSSPKNWAAAAYSFPNDWYTMFPGLTVGTTYEYDPMGHPGEYLPTVNGEKDGEIYLSNDLLSPQAWIWQNASWAGMTGGAGGGAPAATVYPKYDEDAEDAGLYREVTGQPFPTAIVWWTDAGKTVKVKELLVTRDGNQTPTTIQWKFYAAGVLSKTYTDTITYSPGTILETSRVRVIT